MNLAGASEASHPPVPPVREDYAHPHSSGTRRCASGYEPFALRAPIHWAQEGVTPLDVALPGEATPPSSIEDTLILFYDAVKTCHPVDLTFHEPVSREIRDGLAGTSQRTAVELLGDSCAWEVPV